MFLLRSGLAALCQCICAPHEVVDIATASLPCGTCNRYCSLICVIAGHMGWGLLQAQCGLPAVRSSLQELPA